MSFASGDSSLEPEENEDELQDEESLKGCKEKHPDRDVIVVVWYVGE